jgi:hypothetical protein
MEERDILALWKSYDQKLEENLLLNRKNTADITGMKVQSLLASMKPIKIFTLMVGVLWVLFVDTLIINLFSIANPFFLISAGIQVLLTKFAIGIYLYQLILIHQVDVSEPIVATQSRLTRLQSSTLWVARLLFLQLPVWTTFYWNKSMLENGNIFLYIIQIAVTLAFTFLAVWLFRNIRYENRDKKWFSLIFDGVEWTPVIRSMELYREIEAFNEDVRSLNWKE